MPEQPTKAELAARALERARKTQRRARRRVQRLNQRERDRNLRLAPVVVKHDLGDGRGPAGQQSGRVYVRPPASGAVSRFVYEALERRARERAEAAVR
jgi:hypothetical protein